MRNRFDVVDNKLVALLKADGVDHDIRAPNHQLSRPQCSDIVAEPGIHVLLGQVLLCALLLLLPSRLQLHNLSIGYSVLYHARTSTTFQGRALMARTHICTFDALVDSNVPFD